MNSRIATIHQGAAVIYAARQQSGMSPLERVRLRWECCEEAQLMLEHVESLSQVEEPEFYKARDAAERQMLFDAVEQYGNAKAAARAIKVSYRSMMNMLHKYEHPSYTKHNKAGRTVCR
jgi:hypothetical protein